jgi:hypothetical protein
VRRVLLAVAAAAGLLGCGTPSADLFVVERTGDLPDAKLTLRVGDGGTVRCDGGEKVDIPSEDLLDARQLQKDLRPLLDRRTDLPARPGSLLRFRVTGKEGEARFAENSRGLPKVLAQVVAFTRKQAMAACGRER